jgi:hypothetical protein
MGRIRVLGLALGIALSACTKHPPVILGARMPAGCTGDAATSERCIGWILDRLLMTTSFTPYRDRAIAEYVSTVGLRLVAASGDRRPWTFRVLDSTEVQAFAGITTTVYINRGALALLRDESELAGVLGHEIGHIQGGHMHEAFEELGNDVARSTLTDAEQVRAARDDEIQADETAVLLLARSGYDPRGVERMLRAYAATSPDDGDDPNDHHPRWTERIARVQALALQHPGGERGEVAFRTHVATLVVGTDPRTAAMVGDTAVFAHANLAVELPHRGKTSTSDGNLDLELDAKNAIDFRVINAEMAPWFPTQPDKDGAVFQVIVRGNVALAITAMGPDAVPLARALRASVRPPSAAELRAVTPKRVDLDAPRLLWLPPRA